MREAACLWVLARCPLPLPSSTPTLSLTTTTTTTTTTPTTPMMRTTRRRSVATRPDKGAVVALLLRRADSRLWAVPGGRVEAGEVGWEAARREAREEVGVEVGEEGVARAAFARNLATVGAFSFAISHFAVRSVLGPVTAARVARAVSLRSPAEALEVAWVDARGVRTLVRRRQAVPDLERVARRLPSFFVSHPRVK